MKREYKVGDIILIRSYMTGKEDLLGKVINWDSRFYESFNKDYYYREGLIERNRFAKLLKEDIIADPYIWRLVYSFNDELEALLNE